MKVVWSIFFASILILGIINKASSESNVMITEVAGVKAPDIPLGDEFRPDVILDPSLPEGVNVDISTDGVPDGTTVQIKFKDEDNSNPPSGIVENGMVSIPVALEAGNVKVLYAETDSYYTELASFSPQNIDGLKLWLDTNDGVKASSMAARFSRSNNQYLSIPDNPSISLGPNQDFSIALWVNLANKSGQWGQSFINKDDGTGRGGTIEYGPMQMMLNYNAFKNIFRYLYSNSDIEKLKAALNSAIVVKNNYVGWYMIATFFQSIGQWQEAWKSLKIAVNKKPNASNLYTEDFIEIVKKANKFSEAENLIENYINLKRDRVSGLEK